MEMQFHIYPKLDLPKIFLKMSFIHKTRWYYHTFSMHRQPCQRFPAEQSKGTLIKHGAASKFGRTTYLHRMAMKVISEWNYMLPIYIILQI